MAVQTMYSFSSLLFLCILVTEMANFVYLLEKLSLFIWRQLNHMRKCFLLLVLNGGYLHLNSFKWCLLCVHQEAILGKCNVICTSKDKRNPRPSSNELNTADYIFYRTFDVGNKSISEKFADEIDGTKGQSLVVSKNSKLSICVMFLKPSECIGSGVLLQQDKRSKVN